MFWKNEPLMLIANYMIIIVKQVIVYYFLNNFGIIGRDGQIAIS
jgi:hypothetical protein